jgi:hypothetical protein
LSTQYFIAKTVQANEYVLLVGNKVVAGPFPTAAEAVRARIELVDVAKRKSTGRPERAWMPARVLIGRLR